jgi:CDP-paratose 2-epimerase
VAGLFLEFYRSPRCGEVYNMGGGRANSISILETIEMLKERGHTLRATYADTNRVGDHICYISDLRKLKEHFPGWEPEYGLTRIVDEMVAHFSAQAVARPFVA